MPDKGQATNVRAEPIADGLERRGLFFLVLRFIADRRNAVPAENRRGRGRANKPELGSPGESGPPVRLSNIR